jgi:NAD(P)-dependent dehydrogenase (short-subunit alcohol dehydrogenase family)
MACEAIHADGLVKHFIGRDCHKLIQISLTIHQYGDKIMNKLEGKVAVITGASSGIGLATAQRFVSEGAYVYITGRRQRELDAAVRQIGKNVTAVQGDVSQLADLDRLYATVQQQHGRIDIVFANAGVVEVASLGEISEAHLDKMFNINVKGLLFTVQKALPLLQDGGSIILNAGAGSIKGAPAFSVSCAQAAAIRSFARSWTLDLQARQIRVNAVSPGPTDTLFLSHLGQTEEQRKQFLTSLVMTTVPLGRLGDPDEVAKAVVFLASDDSSFITGIELFVDGGQAQI